MPSGHSPGVQKGTARSRNAAPTCRIRSLILGSKKTEVALSTVGGTGSGQACRPNDCFGREVDATHVPGILELELGRGDENDARAPTSKELVERLIPHRAIIETIADPHEQLRSVALARPTMLKQRPCKHRRVSNDHEIEP
eukprot:5038824-Prymnesium_polylepis.1